MAARQYRLEFRKEEVAFVMERANTVTSCSLVGVGSVGKSNLIAHLLNPAVHAYYLGDDNAQGLKLINLDANMLVPLSGSANDDAQRAWAGYELMMHRVFMSFYPFEVLGPDDAQRFYDTYQALQDGRNPLYASMGLRYLELGLAYFLRRGLNIIFLLDEFEELLRQLPIKFFLTLRGLRDNYKSQISFITFSRSPLPVLIGRLGIDPIQVEPFVELFNDHVRYVGPYNIQDAKDMVVNLAKRSAQQIPEALTQSLLDATGRFAGLIRAGWTVLEQNPNFVSGSLDDTGSLLSARKSIQLECQTIWDSLNPSEQTVLKAVARLAPYTVNDATEEAVTMLVQKRLLRVDREGKSLTIEPVVFRQYLKRSATAELSHDR